MEQGSAEWLQLRAGKFTGSRFAALMARTKSGPSTSRANLIVALALERLTGECEATFQNDAMRRGSAMEPIARGAYEAHTGDLVEQVAFVIHPELPHVGVSPDGCVGNDGLIEVKCPEAQHKHLSYLRHGEHANEYHWQIQGQLWVTGRQWCDAVSFDPRFPPGLQLAIQRVERMGDEIAELAAAVEIANAEVDAMVSELLTLKRAA